MRVEASALYAPHRLGKRLRVSKLGTGYACTLCGEPLIERFWPMKAKHRPAAGVGFEKVGEAGFYARALVLERERASWRGQVVRNAFAVFRGL